MTYPVDDAGNPRVDFVWGNMAMQPDDQRDTVTSGPEPLYPANGEGNFGWDATFIYPSEGLYASVEQSLSVGDQSINKNWDDVSYRTVSVPADNHSVALTGYNNYPAFSPNYAGDGDTGLERLVPNIQGLTEAAAEAALLAAGWFETQNLGPTYVGATVANDGKVHQITTGMQNIDAVPQYETWAAPEVPNVVGLTESAANSALVAAHVVKGAVTTANNAAGATDVNDGLVKTQTPAAGTTVNTGASVALVKYAYVAPATTGPISGFNRVAQAELGGSLNGNQAIMYVVGRTVKPAVGDTITVSETTDTDYNVSWTVTAVANNDSYNTGGTSVKLTLVSGVFGDSSTSTGGTWTKI